MSESSYDLLFKGECLPDADPEQVRASVARLLKLDAELEGYLTDPCDCAFWRVG